MVAVVNFSRPDFDHPDEKLHRRQLADATRSLRDGKLDSALDIELSTTAAQTTIEDPRISPTSRIVLTPGNDHAAADLASGTIEIPPAELRPGSCVITHTVFGLLRSFRLMILA